jgi:hypothetical protein
MRLLIFLLVLAACDSDRAQSMKMFEKAAQTAHISFEDKKQVRLFGVHAERSMLGSQPAMILTFAEQVVSPDTVMDKVKTFQARLADADAAIASLAAATEGVWIARDAATVTAMKRLEAARDDAWSTLENARRIPSSS